jgi:VanZ family protein
MDELKKIVPAVIFSILYGISDEIHQLFVVGRVCSVEDVMINTLGILWATIIYIWYTDRKIKNVRVI